MRSNAGLRNKWPSPNVETSSRAATNFYFADKGIDAMKINTDGFKPDRTDRAILRQLQRDASISNVALAAKVNLSAPACLRRVERLREAGLIRATVALLDPKALDAGMLVLIGVVLDRSTPESFTAFEKAAQKVPGCMECHVVTGEFDFFMLIRTRDSDSFNRLHAEKLLYLPGVRQIRTFVVLREILSTTAFPV
jgi:DNA-binding Lrp family transcriptional regulator